MAENVPQLMTEHLAAGLCEKSGKPWEPLAQAFQQAWLAYSADKPLPLPGDLGRELYEALKTVENEVEEGGAVFRRGSRQGIRRKYERIYEALARYEKEVGNG